MDVAASYYAKANTQKTNMFSLIYGKHFTKYKNVIYMSKSNILKFVYSHCPYFWETVVFLFTIYWIFFYLVESSACTFRRRWKYVIIKIKRNREWGGKGSGVEIITIFMSGIVTYITFAHLAK